MSKWTPERLKKDRESWEAKNNSRTTNRTASTGTAADRMLPARLRLQGRTPARALVHGCWRR